MHRGWGIFRVYIAVSLLYLTPIGPATTRPRGACEGRRARWYVAHPSRYRQLEEMLQKCGVAVDHGTINRWVLKYMPQRQEALGRKRPIGTRWRLDETRVKVKGSGNTCVVRWSGLGRPAWHEVRGPGAAPRRSPGPQGAIITPLRLPRQEAPHFGTELAQPAIEL